MDSGFPLLTTKEVPLRLVLEELMWMLRGSTNVRDLVRQDVHIWTGDAHKAYVEKGGGLPPKEFEKKLLQDPLFAETYGYLGPIYGAQWRGTHATEAVDQIKEAIRKLQEEPYSRRNLVDSWDVPNLSRMVLPPCHYAFQLLCVPGVDSQISVDMVMSMRSCDVPLGLPFNIASYGLLLMILCRAAGKNYVPRELIINIADAHIYANQVPGIQEQLTREPRELPTLEFRRSFGEDDFWKLKYMDVRMEGYNPHPSIKMPLSN
jgi:thymidylate synthase